MTAVATRTPRPTLASKLSLFTILSFRDIAAIQGALEQAEKTSRRTGKPARRFKDFKWLTRKSWSCSRRVIAKAEWTQGEANPRFVVTSLTRAECQPRYLYENVADAGNGLHHSRPACTHD